MYNIDKIATEIFQAANKYKVWVETMVSSYGQAKSKVLDVKEFDEKKDADKFKREMRKKYSLKNHAGHVVNYKDMVELFTNY